MVFLRLGLKLCALYLNLVDYSCRLIFIQLFWIKISSPAYEIFMKKFVCFLKLLHQPLSDHIIFYSKLKHMATIIVGGSAAKSRNNGDTPFEKYFAKIF